MTTIVVIGSLYFCPQGRTGTFFSFNGFQRVNNGFQPYRDGFNGLTGSFYSIKKSNKYNKKG